MRTIFIHGGIHKTGSSFIQTALAQNRDLLIRNSIFCPVDKRHDMIMKGIPTAGNGMELVEMLRKKKYDDLNARIGNDFAEAARLQCSSLLYSSEGFFHTFS